MQKPALSGVIAAMLTPRGPDAEIDFGAFERNLAFVLERGVAGVTIGGATGEYPLLAIEERRQLAACARRLIQGRGRLICGAGGASLAESLAIAAHAAEIGADAVLLPPPHFFHYTSEDLEAFYRAAAGAIRLPVLIYHLPAFTAGVPPTLALRLLAECPTIAGVKDSSGSLETLAALGRRFPQRAIRIVGNDAALEGALAAGCCDAVISGVAGVLTELVVALWNSRSPLAGRRLAEFLDRIDALPMPWGLKLAAELRFGSKATFPVPVSAARARQIDEFREWFPGWWARTAEELAPAAEAARLRHNEAMIRGIEHVAIASPNPAELAQWYVDKLGFVINYQSPTTVFVKAPDGAMIEITTSEGERVEQTLKQPGLRHLAITVDEFEATYNELKAKGVAFMGEPSDKKGVKTVFFTDPEGNVLHLIQRETPLP